MHLVSVLKLQLKGKRIYITVSISLLNSSHGVTACTAADIVVEILGRRHAAIPADPLTAEPAPRQAGGARHAAAQGTGAGGRHLDAQARAAGEGG